MDEKKEVVNVQIILPTAVLSSEGKQTSEESEK